MFGWVGSVSWLFSLCLLITIGVGSAVYLKQRLDSLDERTRAIETQPAPAPAATKPMKTKFAVATRARPVSS